MIPRITNNLSCEFSSLFLISLDLFLVVYNIQSQLLIIFTIGSSFPKHNVFFPNQEDPLVETKIASQDWIHLLICVLCFIWKVIHCSVMPLVLLWVNLSNNACYDFAICKKYVVIHLTLNVALTRIKLLYVLTWMKNIAIQ
jgi:hypothetical protein